MKLTLFQTLEDRENPEHVESSGPFKCSRNDAWLGEGYYFWEGHIELAHFWGRNYDRYIICQADAVLDNNCWDLHNSAELRKEFVEILETLHAAGVINKADALVSQVIEFFKAKGKFNYSSIRVLGMESLSNIRANKTFIRRLKFKRNSFQYFDLIPPVQICLIKKNALSLHNFLIVYPSHYVDDIFA